MEKLTLDEARAQGLLKKARIRTSRSHQGFSSLLLSTQEREREQDHSKTKGRSVGRIQHYAVTPEINPQAMLYAALVMRMGRENVLSEVGGLVPGRRFRADIYIPRSRLVVEVDGFAYHKSKSAFQKDRERQNSFMEHGYRILRYYTGQILGDMRSIVDQIMNLDRMILDQSGMDPSGVDE